MTADERRDLLIQRAAVAHPDRTAEEIAKRTYALSDQKVFELLKTSYTG